ncbi:MAG: hypothetical protein ACK58T_00055, partial [Phycisphaerae bacterium]
LIVDQAYDRGAAIRNAEYAYLRALFADLAGPMPAPIVPVLRSAAGVQDTDLCVSALDASNAALKK